MTQRFELIDKDGRVHGIGDKGDMIDLAHALWPGQPQETGDGPEPTSWDIQVADAARFARNLKQERQMESIEALQEQARSIGEKIGEIEDAKRRAENGKKVGRYFKTRNSYSCPEKPSDYWWISTRTAK